MRVLAVFVLGLCFTLAGCKGDAAPQTRDDSTQKPSARATVEVKAQPTKAPPPNPNLVPVLSYPASPSKNCRDGRAKIYDECSSQKPILAEALAKANETKRSVLLIYGAEWCIWCHVFVKYFDGTSRIFNYVWRDQDGKQSWGMREMAPKNAEGDAERLNRYVAENFVVAHIEGQFSPDGPAVLAGTGFDMKQNSYLPIVIALDSKGRMSGQMPRCA